MSTITISRTRDEVRVKEEEVTMLHLLNGFFIWIGIVSWPLILHRCYHEIWPKSWYEYNAEEGKRPPCLGLVLGILAVSWGQLFVLFYQWARYKGKTWFGPLWRIQPNEIRDYAYIEGVTTHLAQPEGFVLLGLYLSVTWLMRWMPDSYYAFDGGIQWKKVALCLLIQDATQFLAHRLEHCVSKAFYRASHKPHHRFTNPRLFDAFNGSLPDTICMILFPLLFTKFMVHCNVWTYMTFGSLYANWLTLIHSEFHHVWDLSLFSSLKFGTAADHHVHHKLFVKNFGHLFMYWDLAFGTYKNPRSVRVFQPKKNFSSANSSKTVKSE
mmetsp:Transcript_6867/g.9606  ORF Transcript_6867/g.9606 Transcript_6867/m.9606 type:complete len:325 (-) Transcript_6867:148-1122(-)